jgi:DNA-directed RNA polymerase specialized sigma24 family protein
MTAEAEIGRHTGTDPSRADEPDPLSCRAVSKAFSRLDPSHREVIHQAYYLGRTTGQIAAHLNVAETIVHRRLHHALHALRHCLHPAELATSQIPPHRIRTI